MTGLRRLSLDDLPRYKAAFEKEHRLAWQHYFPFLYLFSVTAKSEYILISEEGGSLCVYRCNITANGPKLYLASLPMPMNMAVLEGCLARIREHNRSRTATIYWVDEEDMDALNGLGGITATPYEPDYLFDPKTYQSLSGSKTSNLRKNLSYMRAQNDVELRAYTQGDMADCLALLDEWAELQKDKHDKILYQRYTRDCLKFAGQFEDKDLFGKVVLIDGKIRSFGFGGEMRPGLGSLFLAYSDHRIKGLNYFLKTKLMLAMEGYDLVNDGRADTPGLKYAKESLCPVAMHNVYRVKIESDSPVIVKGGNTPQRPLGIVTGVQEMKLEKHARSTDVNIFIKAAKSLGLDFELIGKGSVFCRISHGSNHLLLRKNALSLTSTVHRQLVYDKYLTLQLFEKADVPCPKAKLFGIGKEKEILAYVAVNRPVVIKPKAESLARGVCVNPQDDKAVLDAIRNIKELEHNFVQIENYIKGYDYRFLLYGGQLMGVVKWIPPYVVGDGVMTIKELIEAKNAYRVDNRLSDIVVEHEVIKSQGFAMDSVLPNGARCNVNSRSSHTIGGETTRVDPAKVHPDNLEACFRAAQATFLAFSGVDMISMDISVSYRENGAAINEINACPMIDCHYFADAGEDAQEAVKILKKYFEL
jgi:D-alanine-D-alanine ligase-like ATP-grasp enzyme